MADLLREELATAWQKYFRTRGGGGPSVAQELLPVIVIDHDLPYPPCRIWHIAASSAAVAAQFSIVVLLNNDPLGTRSVVVLDRFVANVASPLMLLGGGSIAPVTAPTMATPVRDIAPEKELQAINPVLGQVTVGTNADAGALPGGVSVYGSASQNQEGPWMLGPQQFLLLQHQTLNTNIAVYMRGRYYGGL